MKSYQYRSEGKSLVSPVISVVEKTLIKIVPWGLSANIITIAANCFFYLAVFLTLRPAISVHLNERIITLLLIIYLIGNHFGGAQAKRTDTSSPLGEFVAHYFEVFNSGLLILIWVMLYEVNEVWLIVAVLLSTYLAHVGLYYLQFKTNVMKVTVFGWSEVILFTAVFIFINTFLPTNALMAGEEFYGFTLIEWLLILCCFGAIVTFINAILNVSHITYGIWLFVGSLVIIGVFSALMFSPLKIIVVVTLYASWYIGKLLTAHLVDGLERSTGLFTPLVLMLAYFWHNLYPANTFVIVIAYMGFNIAILIYRTFSALKTYWVWRNPR